MTALWCNGQWMEPREFSVESTDRGLLLGLGLFETLLAIDGVPVFAERHLARLRSACLRLGWCPDLSHDFPTLMADLAQRNALGSGRSRIRLALTAGSGPLHDLALGADHRIWMSAMPAAAHPMTTSAHLSSWVKNERSPLAGLKCAAMAEHLVALEHAVRRGFGDTVFSNTVGHLCEASTSNIFAVENGTLFTPSLASGCLPGITRAVVLERAASLGIPCVETDLTPDTLRTADEWFLTSSLRGLVGISRFDDRDFFPGPITRILRESWDAAILEGQ